ncbi:glycosyltransferase [Hyphomonas oceanitis]|uniref:Glycosyltransferase n=1 Tax=Hyphomonas oceanitis SCH89 TaxID=1280953 RepID=A0A059G1C0_9PROT|nr:glycosyltransferase [Hyphomonas oceanitis]KDA00339.1 glycosyltransferase [Hyphomonas oceanitis SCH89]
MKILGLGTYPIIKPVHGGQRRVSAFRDYYSSVGVQYQYACVYQGAHYTQEDVSSDDVAIMALDNDPYRAIPLIDDVRAGWQAGGETNLVTHKRLLAVAERFAPDVIQLEQPFMWPFVKRLRQDPRWAEMPVIYSSQNLEAPLKRDMLTSANVRSDDVRVAFDLINRTEAELCRAASLIIACSAEDQAVYRKMDRGGEVMLIPNGVSRPVPPSEAALSRVKSIYGKNRFLFFVGSAYPPNINGFAEMAIVDGVFFIPPEKQLAICGGLCDGIFQTAQYQRYLSAHSDRVQFFPSPSDAELSAVKDACHGVILPVTLGGGSNLKTAEALALGKWIVATSTAMRGFDEFRNAPGVIIADDPKAFQRAMADVLRRTPLKLPADQKLKRETVYWDHAFLRSNLVAQINKSLEYPA